MKIMEHIIEEELIRIMKDDNNRLMARCQDGIGLTLCLSHGGFISGLIVIALGLDASFLMRKEVC